MADKKKLKITLVRSLAGSLEPHRRCVAALGLRKLQHSVVHDDTPAIRGMVHTVGYMLKVEEIGA